MSLILTSLFASLLTGTAVARVPLVVRTYDVTGVAPRTLERAEASAAVTLAAAGIQPIWRPCHASLCTGRPQPHEIEIRIVKATPGSERGALGSAVVDVVEHTGTLATIYIDRVDALATRSGVDRGELLGRAVAHEIGHLVLGTSEHAPFGLMRATWTAGEIQRRIPLDWMFSTEQGRQMRRRLSESPSLFGHEDTRITRAHEDGFVQE
jgi:hypothetical protein